MSEYSHLTYMGLLSACFVVPFLYMVIHRRPLKRYYHLYVINPTVLLSAVPFIIWDICAVRALHWQFNPLYVSHTNALGLPLEEFLFFILIPQSCLLIWVAFKRYHHINQIKDDIIHHFK